MSHLVGTLLDAHYNAAHADHLHVEPKERKTGTPPRHNPGMTPGVAAIYAALEEEFGPGKYFRDSSGRYVGNDPGVYWTHMGGWNRRYIAGTTTWSQHAYWNALDIGPYVGAKAQRKFRDFLLNHTTEGGHNTMLTPKEEAVVKELAQSLEEIGSNGGFVKFVIPWFRELTRDVNFNANKVKQLENKIKALEAGAGGTVSKDAVLKIVSDALRNG